ncbi:MAG: hypothetical protein A2070_02250 [Bdellovibrionales bacterium GWC1_52_8]|nr:MAG: hypothetical protein A2Z97_12665 [Bdellovibrionales bacterium GWB1_52_6]OFZ03332.1 MAG: hypothetical protein A2X97_05155 [Bdellovibrionales bacterium GWA1_52_35]OFZ35672.1 MAG: hypothetical protein A2070_02250 [Bdellovibrionales bacterium GWC1_52_8]HCM40915.1 hypothetical protein [Bdellovibrionales bacterium]
MHFNQSARPTIIALLTLVWVISATPATLAAQKLAASTPATPVLASNEALIVESDQSDDRLPELKWKSKIVQVTNQEETGSRLIVSLVGQFISEDWELIFKGQKIKLDPSNGEFSLLLSLESRNTPFTLTAVNSKGEIRYQKLFVIFDHWEQFVKNPSTPLKGVLAGLGITSSSYTRTGTKNLSSLILTLKASYQAPIQNSRWNWGSSLFVSLLPITNNRSDTSVRFFGISARAGYAVPWLSEPWRLSLLGGCYYTTMFTSGEPIGYRHVAGPMFYPVLQRKLSATDSLSTFAKLSLITNGIGMLALTSKELAWGLSWNRSLANGHPLSLELAIADFQLVVNKTKATNLTYSLGLAYGW